MSEVSLNRRLFSVKTWGLKHGRIQTSESYDSDGWKLPVVFFLLLAMYFEGLLTTGLPVVSGTTRDHKEVQMRARDTH